MTITIRSIKTSINHRSSSAHRSINRSATPAIQSKRIRVSGDLIPVIIVHHPLPLIIHQNKSATHGRSGFV
ncbi:hypothetical protein Hanom_Chr02g00164131 [Helianthus anomalus]